MLSRRSILPFSIPNVSLRAHIASPLSFLSPLPSSNISKNCNYFIFYTKSTTDSGNPCKMSNSTDSAYHMTMHVICLLVIMLRTGHLISPLCVCMCCHGYHIALRIGHKISGEYRRTAMFMAGWATTMSDIYEWTNNFAYLNNFKTITFVGTFEHSSFAKPSNRPSHL